MFTTEEIDELFNKDQRDDTRWIFNPKWTSSVSSHRYALAFVPAERRFMLSRQVIASFKGVEDPALLAAFRGRLDDSEMAACMRLAVNPPPEDDIPF